MAVLFLRSTPHNRTCDFCGVHSDIVWGTSQDDDRDICPSCVTHIFENLSVKHRTLKVNGSKTITNPMLNAFLKTIFDADTKTLIKAGFLNKDGTLTETGIEYLDTLNLKSHMKEMVIAAKEVIQDLKEEKEMKS